jgi:putative transposase
MILGLVDEAVSAGARAKAACEIAGVALRTLQRWKRDGIGDDKRAGPKTPPKNRLSSKERAKIISTLNSCEFRELSPWQVVPKLADRGVYLASESTMYRLLHSEEMQKHREVSRPPQKRHRPKELKATAPNQVWSWDITFLASPILGIFYKAYVVLDVFSRKIVAQVVHEEESSELAARLIEAACFLEGVDRDQLVIHSDNGAPMKGSTLLATLRELGVATSFSRPSVSNDNPYSESGFKTMKCRPNYPSHFESLPAAQLWLDQFVGWYNTEHQHSGINFVTPEQRHLGEDHKILEKRRKVYAAARKRNPDRWTTSTRSWDRVDEVTLNPAPENCEGEAA